VAAEIDSGQSSRCSGFKGQWRRLRAALRLCVGLGHAARGEAAFIVARPHASQAHAEPLAAAMVLAAQARSVAFGPDGLRVGRDRAGGERREAGSGFRARPS
jgi:hypothetical protein